MAKAVYVGVESEKIDFPELQPEMDYTLIGKYTTSQIWTAPEDGTYKIEVHGASGNGGRGTIYDFEDSDGDVWYNWGAGDGGGGSGYGCSIVKMNAGDTITLTPGSVGSNTSVTFNSSVESYDPITVTSGKNATTGSSSDPGAGGTATGGNVSNINGSAGSNGAGRADSYQVTGLNLTGGAGGAPGHADGNTGGKGGNIVNSSVSSSVGSGSAGFVNISRGNTNESSGSPTDGYKQVEYIESTGTQYIDTGFKPNQNTRIIVDMDVLAHTTIYSLFGARTSFQSNAFALFSEANNSGYQDDFGTVYKSKVGGTSSGRHIIDKNKNVLSVDGDTVNTSTSSAFSCPYTCALFTINNGGTYMIHHQTKAKLYSCQIYDNGTLVRDFIPCTRNGEAGLFDKVESKFYANAGTGSFTAGPEVVIPDEAARSVTSMYIGIDNVARKIVKGYIGDENGIARLFWETATSLNDTSWARIKEIADAQEGPSYFAIGDMKAVTLNGTVGLCTFSNFTCYCFIIGFDHNSTREGTGIHFQFGKMEDGTDIAFVDGKYGGSAVNSVAFNMNRRNKSDGGWGSSQMRKTICPAFLNVLPSDLQAVISACTKYATDGGGEDEDGETIDWTIASHSDKIWLLSWYEVRTTQTSYENRSEAYYTKQYAYYAAGNSMVKYRHNATGTGALWWFRSVCTNGSSSFLYNGTYFEYAGYSMGFAPGFKV